ncbi:hypothetical protein ACWOE8_07055 [Enterococcus avium]
MLEKEKAINDLKEFYQNNDDFIGWNRIEMYGLNRQEILNCGIKKIIFPRDSKERVVPFVVIGEFRDELIIFDPKVKGKINSNTYDKEQQYLDSEFVVEKLNIILDL